MNKPSQQISTVSLAIAAGLLCASTVFADPTRVTVRIENVAPLQGTSLTPYWVGIHDGQAFDTYNGNTPANSRPILGSRAMEALCEDGSTAEISADFSTLQPLGQQATLAGPNGPLGPGEVVEQSFVVDSNDPGSRYFSYASMILPSNDFCISNGNPLAHQLFDESGNFVGDSFFVAGPEALDAGTEVNDEIPANTAFFGQAAPNTGVDENGLIGDVGDRPEITGFLPSGSGGILDDPRFSEGDFTLPGYSFAKFTFTSTPAITEELTFRSFLSGRNEVPAVQTRAFGVLRANLVDNGETINLVAAALRLRNVTMAHLHLGAEGENGPVVVDLLANGDLRDRNGVIKLLRANITRDALTGPLAGQPLDVLSEAIQEGNVYINLHTEQNPAGEIRGQLRVR